MEKGGIKKQYLALKVRVACKLCFHYDSCVSSTGASSLSLHLDLYLAISDLLANLTLQCALAARMA